jgi:hypothetical protein
MKTLKNVLMGSLFAAAVVALGACGSSSSNNGTSNFAAALTAAQETPATQSTATGSGTFMLGSDGMTLTYNITHNVQMPTAAHIHMGTTGMAGNPIGALTMTSATVYSGTLTLTADQVTALKANGLYANIHTMANANGEIRGQIMPQ